MKSAKLIFLLIVVFLAAAALLKFPRNPQNVPIVQPTPSPASTFDEDTLIILESLKAGEVITSPLTVTGRARGGWFFEATFPVVLTNWDGLIIAEGFATAEGEWMTEEFVPFTATLEFDTPDYGERGSLILQKANPSGLPENDDALEIEVKFVPAIIPPQN